MLLDSNTTALLGQLGIAPEAVESLLASALWITAATLLAAVPTAMIARAKGRSRALWLLLALSIPLLPLLLVWLLPPADDE